YTILYSVSSPFFNNALNHAGIFISNLFYWDVNYFQLFLLMVTHHLLNKRRHTIKSLIYLLKVLYC
ncbi:MAG: hypothetical protein ACR2GN_08525, partial [Bacteroidia bacterium]